jgi:predicted lipid-binding transport protein (Tim44 family)
MTDAPSTTMPAAHATHDLTVVAALASRGPDPDELSAETARRQVESCTACRDVLADLVTLQAAIPATPTPARPRDLRLTQADADRLRRTGWRRFLGFFGSARDGISRPLAIGFTTLGLAGLMVATLPSMSLGGGAQSVLAPAGASVEQAQPAAGAAGEAYGSDRSAAASGAAASQPVDGAAASEPADAGVFSGANPDELGRLEAAGDGAPALSDDATGLSVLFVVAGMLLIAGLGLFALRWSARRLL